MQKRWLFLLFLAAKDWRLGVVFRRIKCRILLWQMRREDRSKFWGWTGAVWTIQKELTSVLERVGMRLRKCGYLSNAMRSSVAHTWAQLIASTVGVRPQNDLVTEGWKPSVTASFCEGSRSSPLGRKTRLLEPAVSADGSSRHPDGQWRAEN